jgi:hypothetical protein
MFQIFRTLFNILFWFLKRKKAKSHEDFHGDIKGFNKALADGDDDALTIAFDKLRLEGSSGDSRWQTSGMPRRQDKTLSGE